MRKNSLRHSAMRFSLLLSAFLLLAAGTLPAMRADAASVGSVKIDYNDIYITKWTRIESKNDFPVYKYVSNGKEYTNDENFYGLIVLGDKKHAAAFMNKNNSLHEKSIDTVDLSTYSNGSYTPEIYKNCMSIGAKEFYTPAVINGMFWFDRRGEDDDNGNEARFYIDLDDRYLMGDADWINASWKPWEWFEGDYSFEYTDDLGSTGVSDNTLWTLITYGEHGDYTTNTKGKVQFICPQDLDYDVFFDDCGSYIGANGSSGNGDELFFYVDQTAKYPAITKDYTVTAGNTVSLTAGAVLADGVKLTIEPGAVVSVEDVFFNNGTIDNYGTIIVNDNAQIRQLGATDSSAGTINCYGGGYKIKGAATGKFISGEGVLAIMEKGAVIFQHGLGSLYLYGGALVQNYGTVELPDGCVIKESEFINKGNVTTGIKNATVSPTGSSKKSYINCDGGESFIENGGKWNNYSVFVDSGNSHISNVSGSNSGSEHGYGGSGKGEDVITTTTTKTTYIYPEYTIPTPPNGYNGGGVIDDVLR